MFVMDRKRYKQLRVIVTLFVGAIVALAVVRDSYLLAAAGVLTGMVFMVLMRSKAKIRTDERESTIQEKAARIQIQKEESRNQQLQFQIKALNFVLFMIIADNF